MYNNIILSNGDGGGFDCGINVNSTGVVYVAYNDIFGNANAQTNNPGGGMVWGPGNKLTDPMLDTVSAYTITSTLSPAVDSATNILGVSDIYNGFGPDMGWKESAFISVPQLNIVKTISSLSNAFNNTKFIPGAKITYSITYSNVGAAPSTNSIIYDQLPNYTTYLTNFMGTATGWTLEYSTNASPDQFWTSSDYTNTIPADKTKITWIRWRKPDVLKSETATFYYKVMIK